MGKNALSSSSPPDAEQGKGRAAPAAADSAALGLDGGPG